MKIPVPIVIRHFGALLLGLVILLLGSAAGVGGEEDSERWTDTLHTKEGIFAFSVDVKAHRVLVIRADDKSAGNTQLRVRLFREGRPLLLILRRAEASGAPWRYSAEGMSESLRGDRLELEASEDGKVWRILGKFQKPTP